MDYAFLILQLSFDPEKAAPCDHEAVLLKYIVSIHPAQTWPSAFAAPEMQVRGWCGLRIPAPSPR
jgi:hypothetical protein